MISSSDLSEKIKLLAKSKNIKTGVMLLDCGLNKNQLATMKNGSYPDLKSLDRISQYLGVTVSDLLSDEAIQQDCPFAIRIAALDDDGKMVVGNAIIQEERRMQNNAPFVTLKTPAINKKA